MGGLVFVDIYFVEMSNNASLFYILIYSLIGLVLNSEIQFEEYLHEYALVLYLANDYKFMLLLLCLPERGRMISSPD